MIQNQHKYYGWIEIGRLRVVVVNNMKTIKELKQCMLTSFHAIIFVSLWTVYRLMLFTLLITYLLTSVWCCSVLFHCALQPFAVKKLPSHDRAVSTGVWANPPVCISNSRRCVITAQCPLPVTMGIYNPLSWDKSPAYNNNNNNKHDDVYGAVHHGTAIARVHPVHLMNVEWRQAAADTRPSQTT